MQIGSISRLRFCSWSWRFCQHLGVSCVFLGSQTFVPISLMCKKQTAVSHSSKESDIISLDTWDLVIEVLHLPTQRDFARENLVQHKCEKYTKGRAKRFENFPTIMLLLYIFEGNEAVIKLIIESKSPTMRHASRTHSGTWLVARQDGPMIQVIFFWHPWPTRWHFDQKDFYSWRVGTLLRPLLSTVLLVVARLATVPAHDIARAVLTLALSRAPLLNASTSIGSSRLFCLLISLILIDCFVLL